MKTMRFLSMAAVALVGAIMAGCSSSDDDILDTPQQPGNTGKVVTLTTTVNLDDGGATTRALTADGVKTFAAGETMALYYNNGTSEVKAVSHALEAGDIAEDCKSATFTFELTNPDKSKSVKYIYPAAIAKLGTLNLNALSNQQDGTLAKLASDFDAAASDYLDWDGDNLPSADLENKLAILAVTLKDNATNSDITSTITGLTISDGTNTYAVTRPASEGPIYVAILPTSSATINVTATDGTKYYFKTLTSKTYKINNGYNVSWKMTYMNTTPLTVEAITGGTIVVNNPQSGMQYSVNGGAKNTVSSVGGTISVNAGDKVQFYGNAQNITQYGTSNANNSTEIAGGTASVKVYGNIMSLVNEEDFATNIDLTKDYTFSYIFYNNTALTDASGLFMPATKLTNSCYMYMFTGCTSLTAAPALPATTLATSCYRGMFYGCTSLTAAPVLPATTLTLECYYAMFNGCSSLTVAPVLPATTLTNHCYQYMFMNNSSLNTVTCLATNISANDCTTSWLNGVAATGTFTKAASMTGWGSGANGIPSGWTVKDAE